MAGEIQLPYTATGQTLYVLIRNSVGQVWQTTSSTFVAYVTANIANYKIALTEQGSASQFYTGTFPTAIGRGVYTVTVYKQGGGSPAEGDTLVGNGGLEWTGSAVIVPAQSGLPINTAKTIPFVMLSNSDHQTPAPGLTVTASYSLDGGAIWTACSNAVSEVGGGIYKIALLAAEMNGGIVLLKFTAMGADVNIVPLITTP